MNTSTTATTRTFKISESIWGGFVVEQFENGLSQGFLRQRGTSIVRRFNSRSGARKAITREIRGDFHR